MNPLTNYFFTKAMIDQLDHRNGTIGDFMLGVQRRLYHEGKRSLAEMAQDDRFAKQLMKAVPDKERKVLLAPERLRHAILMYNLLGDPASELKLPQEMSLTVSPAGNDAFFVSGETATDCSELICDFFRGRREGRLPKAGLSKRERREHFEEMNQPPETLLGKQLSGKAWKIQVSLPYEKGGEADYLRCIAIGREGSYVGWSKVGQNGNEISSDLYLSPTAE